MAAAPMEDGLHVVETDDEDADHDAIAAEDGAERDEVRGDGDLETLRDAFVEAFNARDLDAILAVVSDDVETPDTPGNGAANLAEEIEAIWERSPEAFLTRGFLDDAPIAVAWRPDEEGVWTRVALVCFDCDGEGLINLVELPEDVDGLERAVTEDPTDEQIDEWADWAEWDRGEETVPARRDRRRP
jgi:hypothetical protein